MRRATNVKVVPKKGKRRPMSYCYHRDVILLERHLEKTYKGDSRKLKGASRKHWLSLSLNTRAKILERINERMFVDLLWKDLKKAIKESSIQDGTYSKRVSASDRCLQLYGHLVP